MTFIKALVDRKVFNLKKKAFLLDLVIIRKWKTFLESRLSNFNFHQSRISNLSQFVHSVVESWNKCRCHPIYQPFFKILVSNRLFFFFFCNSSSLSKCWTSDLSCIVTDVADAWLFKKRRNHLFSRQWDKKRSKRKKQARECLWVSSRSVQAK